MSTVRNGLSHKVPRGVKAAAFGVSLILSALSTVAALRWPQSHWLVWMSFVPLFAAIRCLRPLAASSAGAVWSACLCLFLSTSAGSSAMRGWEPGTGFTVPPVEPSVSVVALLMSIPTVYIGLAARSTRGTALDLIRLALGWTLLEVVLHLHSLTDMREGVLSTSGTNLVKMHWLGRLLAYVCSAFVVAYANASLVRMLTDAGVWFLIPQSLIGSLDFPGRVARRKTVPVNHWATGAADPRAPPLFLAALR